MDSESGHPFSTLHYDSTTDAQQYKDFWSN